MVEADKLLGKNRLAVSEAEREQIEAYAQSLKDKIESDFNERANGTMDAFWAPPARPD